MVKVAPSILSADFANLEKDIKRVEQEGVEYIHIDVMDGHFVPNLTFGPNVVSALRKTTSLTLDVHLMMMNPERYISEFIEAGSDIITVHVESTLHLHRVIQQIKAGGKRAGVVINPGTPVESIVPVLSMVDLVLVMTVNPGFGGQAFIENCLIKIEQLDQLREANHYTYEIEVDGGVNAETGEKCVKAGADVLVAGSYIYNQSDISKPIHALRGLRRP